VAPQEPYTDHVSHLLAELDEGCISRRRAGRNRCLPEIFRDNVVRPTHSALQSRISQFPALCTLQSQAPARGNLRLGLDRQPHVLNPGRMTAAWLSLSYPAGGDVGTASASMSPGVMF